MTHSSSLDIVLGEVSSVLLKLLSHTKRVHTKRTKQSNGKKRFTKVQEEADLQDNEMKINYIGK